MTSDFVGVVNLQSESFLSGDSILSAFSVVGGLLCPSGSGLVGFVFRAEREAGWRERRRIKTSTRGERSDEQMGGTEPVALHS